MLTENEPWKDHSDSGRTRLCCALGEDQREQEAVPDVEGVVDGDGDDGRLARAATRRHEHAASRAAPSIRIDSKSSFGDVAQEVHQDQHRDRDREGHAEGRMIARSVS